MAGAHSRTAAVLSTVAPLALGLALLAYLAGGALTAISEVRERCAKQIVPAGTPLDHMDGGFLPLHWTCVFQDGTTYEGVPAWTNPTVFDALGVAAACVVAAIAVSRAFRRGEGKNRDRDMSSAQ